MKNKLKLIPILGVLPFFLMGNSGVPYPEAEPYKDVEILEVTVTGYNSDLQGYRTVFKVKNSGDWFFDFGYSYISYDNNGQTSSLTSEYGSGLCLGPGQTCDWVCTAPSGTISIGNLKNIDFYGHKKGKSISFEYAKHIPEAHTNNEYGEMYYYYFEIGELEFNDRFYYEQLVEYEIDGVTYGQYIPYGPTRNFDIYTGIKCNNPGEDIQIKAVYLNTLGNYYAREINNRWEGMWIIFGIAVGAALLISPGFIPLIVYSAKKRTQKKNNG